MTETARLGLPLVAAAQAQKHVTVNEAFARLDALTALTLKTIGGVAPPPAPAEGDVYAVGAGATGAWAGAGGKLALYLNGGWSVIAPQPGWRGWSVSDGAPVTFDGTGWVAGTAAFGPSGAGVQHAVIETDHPLVAGAANVVAGALPAGALVLGVSARVLSAIGGAMSVDLGVSGDATRFGAGLGVAAGATLSGIGAGPTAYPGGGDLRLTAVGGSFNGTGSVRLAVHVVTLSPPRP